MKAHLPPEFYDLLLRLAKYLRASLEHPEFRRAPEWSEGAQALLDHIDRLLDMHETNGE